MKRLLILVLVLAALPAGAQKSIRLGDNDELRFGDDSDWAQVFDGTNLVLKDADANEMVRWEDAGTTGDLVVSGTLTIGALTAMTGITLAGDGGANQTINDGNTLTIAGGAGIATTGGATDTVTVALSHLGIESMSDPGAVDRIYFWDDGAGASAWLVPNQLLSISGTDLDVDNDLHNYSWTNVVDGDLTDTITVGAGGTVADAALSANVAHVNATENISAVWEVQDDTRLNFGNDADFGFDYQTNPGMLILKDADGNYMAAWSDTGATGNMTVYGSISATADVNATNSVIASNCVQATNSVSGSSGAFGTLALTGDAAVNGGDLTSSAATVNVFNVTPATINLGGAADVNIGGAAKTVTVAGTLTAGRGWFTSATSPVLKGAKTSAATTGGASVVQVQHTTSADMIDGFGALIDFVIQDSAQVDNIIGRIRAYRDGADNSGGIKIHTFNAGASEDTLWLPATGPIVTTRDWAVNGGDITSSAATATLFNTTSTTVNIGGAADVYLGTTGKVVATLGKFVGGTGVEAGADGVARGVFTAWDGAGGNTPGCWKLASPNGTVWYYFAEDDGTLKCHNALPTANADGNAVGDQTD